MATRVIVGIVALICASTYGMIASFFGFEMMDKVNDKLPKENRFDPVGWYLPKTLRLYGEYRRLYPDGNLLLKVRVLGSLMIVFLLVCAWGLGFFS
jgi:hypothetical protein